MPAITASKPARTIRIDRDRQIRINWAAANRFEETFGKSIPEALQGSIGTRLITVLTWAGMLHEEPSLTLRETERRIQSFINQDGDIAKLGVELSAALVEGGVIGKAQVDEDEAERLKASEGNAQAVTTE